LIGSQTALGVLPAGSLNVFARQLGLPNLTPTNIKALEQAAASLAQAPARAVDVGLLDGRPFLLWAGLGIDGQIVHEMETKRAQKLRRFAILRYLGPTLARIRSWGGLDLALEVDGERLAGRYILAVAANIPAYVGGYLTLSPNARLDDGLMDFWLFEGDSPKHTWAALWNVITGRHQRPEHARHFQFRELKLSGEPPLAFQLDGDPVETGGSAVVQVKRRALRLLTPVSAPQTLFSSEEAPA
jgi:diacylglycerol kinase family enzyme